MAQRYVEAVLMTAKGIGEGFIRGWFRAKGDPSEIINLEREEITRESFRGLIEEFTHPGEEILHLLIPENNYPLLGEAVMKLNEEGFAAEDKGGKHYENISAEFKVEIYHQQSGTAAKKMLTHPLDGVTVEFKKKLKESVTKDAKEVELYAPEHDYELKGSGVIQGSIKEVLGLIKNLRENSAEIINIKLY
jgi:hypothetical protein